MGLTGNLFNYSYSIGWALPPRNTATIKWATGAKRRPEVTTTAFSPPAVSRRERADIEHVTKVAHGRGFRHALESPVQRRGVAPQTPYSAPQQDFNETPRTPSSRPQHACAHTPNSHCYTFTNGGTPPSPTPTAAGHRCCWRSWGRPACCEDPLCMEALRLIFGSPN